MAWQPKKQRPPRIVQSIHFTTSYFWFLCPASTANTIVTDDIIKIKVMIPTNTNGCPCSAIPGIDWKILSASIQVGCATFCATYNLNTAADVNSYAYKQHNILPYTCT